MIVIPHRLARAFRAAAGKCVSGRPRGPAPDVVMARRAGTLTVWARTPYAALLHVSPAAGTDETVVLPAEVLDAVGANSPEAVTFAVGAKRAGEARWTAAGGVPNVRPFDALLPGRQHEPLADPDELAAVAPEFLRALHECGRAAARDAGRPALTRVQVDGRAGRVAGTDGHAAVLWGGFALPFADAVLVPAVPVFGVPELARQPDARVGRTPAHLVVAAGPWRVLLPVDAAGRYPDVAGVIPKHPTTTAELDDADAQMLLSALPPLPGAADDGRPVTLDLAGRVAVRGRDEATGRVETVALPRSSAVGPAARVAVDRRPLAQALALGCRTVAVAAPGKPVAFAGGPVTVVTVTLDPVAAVGPDDAGSPPATNVAPDTPDTLTRPERRTVMRPETNGHPPPAGDPPDPLAAAEELRAALADAAAKAGRLVAALKSRRKEQRALSQAWTSLKALNLGTGGGP